MIPAVLYQSRSEEWSTPQEFFDALDAEFQFTLDACATKANAKCARYFTRVQNGLIQNWGHERVFCNPPYGRTMRAWAGKCAEASRHGALVVMLTYARTDTRWFHDHVQGKAELRFVPGRLKFGDSAFAAPFPSLVAVYRPPGACPAYSASSLSLAAPADAGAVS